MTKARRIAFCAVFTALAAVLSILESYIPVGLLIPIPGIKLGLANIVTVFAVLALSPLDAALIVLARCLFIGVFTGPVPLFFSLSGSMLAFLVMKCLSFGVGRIFSVIGVSMGGAVAHAVGQVLAAVLLMQSADLLFSYLPLLLIASLITGALTGAAALPLLPLIRRVKNPCQKSGDLIN